MADSTTRALDLLTDLTLSPREAMRRFARLARRWKPASVGFVLHVGGYVRSEKERRAFDHNALSTWADDGGRA